MYGHVRTTLTYVLFDPEISEKVNNIWYKYVCMYLENEREECCTQ